MKKIKIYCIEIAFILLLITSKQSFFYPINDWCDTNAFFTIGKSWMNGIMPYKILYEQKGPILYLLYGLGTLISNKTFIGCFIIEVIFFSMTLYYSYKIINRFLDGKESVYILILYALIITTSISFYGGGSAEEFSLFFITYNIYSFLKLINDEEISSLKFFINGLFCGIVFLIKFNLVAFWIGFLIVFFLKNIKQKKIFAKKTLTFCLGFAIPLIFFLIYFYINSSLYEFVDVYFIKNMFLYPSTNFKSLIVTEGLNNILIYNFKYDPLQILLLIYYVIYIFIYIKKGKQKIYYILMLIFPYIFLTCLGTWYEYYFLPLSVFILLGLVWLIKQNNIKKIFSINKYVYIIIVFILALTLGKNTNMLKYKKEDFVQYKFGQIINNYEDKTILNYGFVDTGFYLETNTLPNIRFFHTMNFSDFEEMEEEQLEYINNKKTNFVIVTNIDNNIVEMVKQQYQILDYNYELIKVERHNKNYGLYYGLYKSKK